MAIPTFVPTVPITIHRLKNVLDLPPKANFLVTFYDLLTTKNGTPQIWRDPITLTLLSTFCRGMKAPEMLIEPNDVVVANNSLNIVKNIKYSGDFTISFYPDSTNLAKKFYYTWLGNMTSKIDGDVRSSRNLSKPRNFYERDISVTYFDRIGTPIEIRKYMGCYPIGIEELTYDKNETGLQETITITFKINDGVEITFLR